jgi:hypothetical protein
MSRILMSLDAEWRRLARSPRARRALRRWALDDPALNELRDLDQLLERRRNPDAAHAVLTALAALAPTDDLAARTLLQALLPGLVRLAGTAAYDDPTAIDEMVSLAWERIRTYPPQRAGSVAANVLFDVRKRYRAHRAIDTPRRHSDELIELHRVVRSPEDEAVARVCFQQLMSAQKRHRVLGEGAFRLVLRTRLAGEPLADVARQEGVPRDALAKRRWRAECRLRQLPLAG